MPIILGVTGYIYKEHTDGALQALGVTPMLRQRVIKKLHTHALQSLHTIITTRRRLDKKLIKRQFAQGGDIDPGGNHPREGRR